MADPLVLVRAVHLLATMLVVGTVFFDAVVLAPAFAGAADVPARLHGRSHALLAGGLALAVLSGAAWFGVLAMRLRDTSPFGATAWTLATETQFGTVWMLRFAFAAALATGLAQASGARASRGRTIIMLGAGAAFAGTLAWCGHGAATPGVAGGLHAAADALHAFAAAVWLGGLLPLALLLGREGRNDDLPLPVLATVLRRFSALGVAAVAMLIASGVVNTLFALDRVAALWTTDYGRALLVKIALFAGMLVLAGYNRQTLTPGLARSANAHAAARLTHRLCVHAAIETALGVAIIAIVAWLGITEPVAGGAHIH
jgi:putative copper resistance protein D